MARKVISFRCPSCGAAEGALTAARTTISLVDDPYPAQYATHLFVCPNCQAEMRESHRLVDNGVEPPAVRWAVADENLLPGRDYQILKGEELQPGLNSTLVWAWQPMWNSLQFRYRLVNMLKDCLVGYGQRPLTLIMPPADVSSMDDLMGSFRSVIRLKSHVMAGVEGPYPSIRAEYSIARMVKFAQNPMIKHIWPAATLPAKDYMPLGSDEELRLGWSMYARSSISLEIPEGSK